jgi:uncharacterized protein YggE
MNVKVFCFLGILTLIGYSLCAQTQSAADEKPFVEVTGTAELEIVPDEIFVDIVIQEHLDKDKLTVEMQEDKLKTALGAIGIDLKNLSLSAASASYIRMRWKGKDVLSRKNYRLKLSDAVTVGRLFEQLDKLDIDNAYISAMNHSKMDSLRREINIKAIKAAKDKADYMLAAIGSKAGKPLIVQEREYTNPETLNRFRENHANYSFKEDMLTKSEEDVQLKTIKVHSAIFVKFQVQ